jgi:hypothetical protein
MPHSLKNDHSSRIIVVELNTPATKFAMEWTYVNSVTRLDGTLRDAKQFTQGWVARQVCTRISLPRRRVIATPIGGSATIMTFGPLGRLLILPRSGRAHVVRLGWLFGRHNPAETASPVRTESTLSQEAARVSRKKPS